MTPRHSSFLNNHSEQQQQLPRTLNGSFKGKKRQSFVSQLKQLDVKTIVLFVSKHRKRLAWTLVCILFMIFQVLLLKRAYKRHVYKQTVQKNHLTLSRGGTPPLDAWWRDTNLTIFTIWIGNDVQPPPVISAAMESCKSIHADTPNLHYKVITNDDLDETNLGFELHSSFYLLDNVEKSDYLRGELLHNHGGFYMDADMVCLTNFQTLFQNGYMANAAQDAIHYGPWPSVSQNAFGPFRAHSEITQKWHDLLFAKMDSLTPLLKKCVNDYGGGDIPYPTSRRWGTSLCGIEWGGVIDFVKPVWLEFFESGEMGHDMSMCNVDGQHVGWDDYRRNEKCDIVHLGTAGDFYKRKEWTMERMCREMPALFHSVHCRRGGNNNNTK